MTVERYILYSDGELEKVGEYKNLKALVKALDEEFGFKVRIDEKGSPN